MDLVDIINSFLMFTEYPANTIAHDLVLLQFYYIRAAYVTAVITAYL